MIGVPARHDGGPVPAAHPTSPMSSPLQAVVFDFDGLVIDSELVIYEMAAGAFAAHGHELTMEAWAAGVGVSGEEADAWWPAICEAAGAEGFALEDFEAAYRAQARDLDAIPLMPGVTELLKALHYEGVPCGVASSSNREWLVRHTTRFGLTSYFQTLVGADVVGGRGKPAPAVYLRALEDLGADPARSVALEDSAHGAAAAKAAGMAVVAVPSELTRHNDFSHVDLVVSTLLDVDVELLESLVAARD